MKKGGVLLLVLFFLLQPVYAYDQHSTHPSLTYEMAQFFNQKNTYLNKFLLPKEIGWLKQGAVEEDEPARWINHFYDPVHNVGWSGKHLGKLSQEEGYKLGGDIAPRHSIASVDWVTNQQYQAAYGRQYGNQTWQKAIKSYIYGDKKSAFLALGHVLHLIEDATVPDHVRDDSHPGIEGDPGSPYENFSKIQTDAGELLVAEKLLSDNMEFKKLISVNQAIKDLAIYTNQNFFSEDTADNDEFLNPYINNLTVKLIDKKEYLYNESLNIYISKINFNNGLDNKKFTTSDILYVLPSYRDHLFPEAVLTGASVINLFFQEVEKYQKNPQALEDIVPDSYGSFAVALQQFPKRTVIKACGISESTCKDIHNSAVAMAVSVQNSANNAIIRLGSIVQKAKTVFGINTKAVSQSNAEISEQITPENSEIVSAPVVKVLVAPIPNISRNTQAPVVVASPQKPIISDSAAPSSKIVIDFVSNNQPLAPAEVTQKPQSAVYGGGLQGVSSLLLPLAGVNTGLVAEPEITEVSSVAIVSSTENNPVISVTTTINSSTAVENNTVTSSPPEIVVDNESPTVPSVAVSASSTNSVARIITLASSDALSEHIYFDLQFTTNTQNGFWENVASSTAQTAIDFSGTRGQLYYFRARAADDSGNVSVWSNASSAHSINWSGELVVNEVAWAGTASEFSTNEWFELYNTTDADIDVSNWKIFISGKQLSISKVMNKIIPAHGYYLFERISDNTVKEIAAGAIFSGSLNNSGEKIEIFRPDNEKSDEVDARLGWFAGDAVKYRSMERIDVNSIGNDPANWQSNQGFRESGRSFNGGPIYGSPKRANTGFINLNWDQDEEVRVLTKANNPYLLQYYTVPAGKKLIIEPGVVIKSYFNNSSLTIFGAFEVHGTSDDMVFFTSGKDANLNSTINNTVVGVWITTTPAAYDWQGIWFKPGSAGVIENAQIRFAGHGFIVPPSSLPVSQAIRIDRADVSFNGVHFSDNGTVAMLSSFATTAISHSEFSGGERAFVSENSAVHIEDTVFRNFSHGYGPLYIKDKWPSLERITYTGNTINMPYLESVVITDSATMNENENFLVNILTVSSSGHLSIMPGVSVYVPLYGIINVYGSLEAHGTVNNMINFLPLDQSSNWGNIRFYNSTSTLEYVNFKRGNRLNGRPESVNGTIVANDSHLFIGNMQMLDSESNSIQSNNSVISIIDSEVSDTVKHNNTIGIKAMTGTVNLNNVRFANMAIGLQSDALDISHLMLDVQNMSSSSFDNVDYFWQPLNLWAFPVLISPEHL
jgi:hypothetical protein